MLQNIAGRLGSVTRCTQSAANATARKLFHSAPLAATSGAVEQRLYMVGGSRKHQLGIGKKSASVPTLVEGLPAVQDVAIGKTHALAVTSDGDLYAWGSPLYGKTGIDAGSNVSTPQRIVENVQGVKFKAVAAGDRHSMALDTDGNVWTWGEGGSALRRSAGALGLGDRQQQDAPVPVEALETRVTSIAAGARHSLATGEDGKVFAWGMCKDGRLGHGDNKDYLLPKAISSIDSTKMVKIAAGFANSASISSKGSLFLWGKNRTGECGRESHSVFSQERTPWAQEDLSEVECVDVSYGKSHGVAVTAEGNVYVWGAAGFQWFKPSLVSDLSSLEGDMSIIGCSAGQGYTAVWSKDGKAYLWGANRKGCLGLNVKTLAGMMNKTRVNNPTPLLGISDDLFVNRVVCGHKVTGFLCSLK